VNQLKKGFLAAGAAGLALLTPACYIATDSGPLEHSSQSVDLRGAKSVEADIEMGAGEIVMRGAAAGLMDADFRYRGNAKPEVRYDVAGDRGALTVRQSPTQRHMGGNDKDQWDLRLNEDIPLDLRVKLGAGEGRLNLGSLALRSVRVEMGAGELKLDLTGHPRGDVNVEVHGGVGSATVKLPRRARLDVEAHGGIGQINAQGLTKRDGRWVNEPEGRSEGSMRVTVNGGIGEINLICE